MDAGGQMLGCAQDLMFKVSRNRTLSVTLTNTAEVKGYHVHNWFTKRSWLQLYSPSLALHLLTLMGASCHIVSWPLERPPWQGHREVSANSKNWGSRPTA